MDKLDSLIDNSTIKYDAELSTAIRQLKNNPAQLQQFLQTQQDVVFKDIIKQKDNTLEKVYGDLNHASTAQESMLINNKRNNDLSKLTDVMYVNQKDTADAVVDDINLAERKYEMNEWSINNKKDTLFIFSLGFIILSGLVLLSSLWKMGIISLTLLITLGLLLVVILVFTIVNRSVYTNILRNKRYWNRQIFEGKYGTIPSPIPTCPSTSSLPTTTTNI
jgi:hypothetical protein